MFNSYKQCSFYMRMWPEVLEFEKTLDMTQFSILLTHKKKQSLEKELLNPRLHSY